MSIVCIGLLRRVKCRVQIVGKLYSSIHSFIYLGSGSSSSSRSSNILTRFAPSIYLSIPRLYYTDYAITMRLYVLCLSIYLSIYLSGCMEGFSRNERGKEEGRREEESSRITRNQNSKDHEDGSKNSKS